MSDTGSGSKFTKIISFFQFPATTKGQDLPQEAVFAREEVASMPGEGLGTVAPHRLTCSFADDTGLWGRGADLGQRSSMASEALAPKKRGPHGLGRGTTENGRLLFTHRRGWRKYLTITFPANHTMTVLWELITEIIPMVNLSVKGVGASNFSVHKGLGVLSDFLKPTFPFSRP